MSFVLESTKRDCVVFPIIQLTWESENLNCTGTQRYWKGIKVINFNSYVTSTLCMCRTLNTVRPHDGEWVVKETRVRATTHSRIRSRSWWGRILTLNVEVLRRRDTRPSHKYLLPWVFSKPSTLASFLIRTLRRRRFCRPVCPLGVVEGWTKRWRLALLTTLGSQSSWRRRRTITPLR